VRLRFWRKKPPPLDLTSYQGNWVAVKDGVLVAYAPTAVELVAVLTSDETFKGATAWFDEFSEKVMHWSVQYPSRPGHVFPNDLFSTRESAQAWIDSWARSGREKGEVFTRAGQHEPWVKA